METGEVICEKVFASPRPPPKSSLKGDWLKELDSGVAGGSEDSQRIQTKTKTPFVRTGRPVLPRVRVLRKSTTVSYLAAKAPMQEQGDLFPVVCQCLLNV